MSDAISLEFPEPGDGVHFTLQLNIKVRITDPAALVEGTSFLAQDAEGVLGMMSYPMRSTQLLKSVMNLVPLGPQSDGWEVLQTGCGISHYGPEDPPS